MKKIMLFVVVLATFFSCTDIIDELDQDLQSGELLDSLSNTIQRDTIYVIIDKDTIPDNGQSARVGLFASTSELKVWQERTQTGPFKTNNDVGSNSPGDYQRIIENANSFLQNPSEDRVKWPNEPLVWGSYEPRGNHVNLRDAAFVYALTGNIKYGEAVKKELLAQSTEPSLDFSNSAAFNTRITTQNPWFDIAAWLTRLLYSYDLVEETFSNAEKETMKNWFLEIATKYQESIDKDFLILWPNRNSGNYTPSKTASEFRTYTHDGGYKVYTGNKWYSNRAAAEVRLYGLVGLKYKNYTLINSAKRWFKEWITFGIYPSGLLAEFHRTYDQPSREEAGYDYSSITTDCMVNLADAFARTGDFELYDFTTSDGLEESKGGSKSLLLVMQTLSNLLYDQYYDPKTKSYAIYSGTSHTTSTKIDGRRDGDFFARPIWFAQANIYYNDPVINQTYNKIINEGLKHNSVGGLKPFGGAWDLLPGVLFMWGNLEGEIYPYTKAGL